MSTVLRMSSPDGVAGAARAFLGAAFEVLRAEHVLPRPDYAAFVRVGSDYYGGSIMGLAEYGALQRAIEEAYAPRFEYPPQPRTKFAQFVQTFIFGLLEAAIARCSVRPDFSASAAAVGASVEELVAVLGAQSYEIACCRMVVHATTAGGKPTAVGDIEVIPVGGGRSASEVISDVVPAARGAEPRGNGSAYDPPHAVVVARAAISSDADPYAAAERLSSKLERFLLHTRLLTGATTASHYEVAGTTTLIGAMPAFSTTFLGGRSRVRRTARFTGRETAALRALGGLIDQAEIKRQGMALTSFDAALRKFHGSYGFGNDLDHLVDLATALEAALAGGNDENEGLTLRLRSRAASLAGEDDPAPSIFNDVRALYSLPSSLVHGGAVKEKRFYNLLAGVSTVPRERIDDSPAMALAYAVDRMRDLVRRAILARLLLAAAPEPLWPFDDRDVLVDAELSDNDTRELWLKHWQDSLANLGAAEAARPPRAAVEFLSPDDR